MIQLRRALVFALALYSVLVSAQVPQKKNGIEITTSSPEARTRFEQGLGQMETLHWEAALKEWRQATQADPQFALAHIFLAMLSRDPAEQAPEREKAVANRRFAGTEEQLII